MSDFSLFSVFMLGAGVGILLGCSVCVRAAIAMDKMGRDTFINRRFDFDERERN